MPGSYEVQHRARIPGDIPRPLVPVEVENVGTVLCILDSGADMTTMPLAIAEKAGLNAKRNGRRAVSECAHGHEGVSYEMAAKLVIFGKAFYLSVNFVEDGKEPALLGRKGFFDKFEVTFKEADSKVILTPLST